MQFSSGRKAQIEADTLHKAAGTDRISLDRLAIALSIAAGPIDGTGTPYSTPTPIAAGGKIGEQITRESKETQRSPLHFAAHWNEADGRPHNLHRLDSFEHSRKQVFGPILNSLAGKEYSPAEICALLRCHINRGYDILYRAFETNGEDWLATLQHLSPPDLGAERKHNANEPVQTFAIDVGVNEPDGQPVSWIFNREGGSQTNANARLAGMPGVGKSQVLLNLLSSIAEQSPKVGFILLDYKGDLAANEQFVADTGATIIRPGDEPIPINPFQLPDTVNLTLAPRAFAESFKVLSRRIGPIQEGLVTRAMERCYSRNVLALNDRRMGSASEWGTGGSGNVLSYPTLSEILEAVTDIYQEEGRKEDSLLTTLADLTRYNLFAQVSEKPLDEIFSVRWIVDLAGLQALRPFVAFVLLEFLHQAARGLSDATYNASSELRQIRGVVAIDEAHYYFKERCGPLLDLLRIGRSKGVPVFLSSQSLEDFKGHTELNEFLPSTFVFKHGVPPDRRTMAGALRTDLEDARVVAARTSALEKFKAYVALATGHDPKFEPAYHKLTLRGFWERHG